MGQFLTGVDTKGYEFLDKELTAITRGAKIGKRFVDKLIKLWRNDGMETWFLVHLEVQGQSERGFKERMFTYHYRAFDRYKRPILSLAILTDASKRWRPKFYAHALWGCRLRFDFMTIKLLDFENQYSWQTPNSNPFLDVILLHLSSLRTKKNDRARLASKLRLTRNLYRRGWNKETFMHLYNFLDWVLALPEPLEIEYTTKIEHFEEKKNMAYISSAERIGMGKGILEGERAILLHLLQLKFGSLSSNYKCSIEKANAETLQLLTENILHATSLQELFKAVCVVSETI